MRILIVDDDPATRHCLVRVLQDCGQADTAENGEQALERFAAALDEGSPYGLVCLDINMPRLDGQEALKRMRELEGARAVAPGAECKVVMTTALVDTGSVTTAFFKGQADGYVRKPLRMDELKSTLRGLGVPLA